MTVSVSKCGTQRNGTNEGKENVCVFILRVSVGEFTHPLFKVLTGLWGDPAPTPLPGRLWPWWGSWWFSAFWTWIPYLCCHREADVKVCDSRSRSQGPENYRPRWAACAELLWDVRPPEWSDFPASHLLLCEELVYIREAAPDLTVYFWQERHSRDGRDLLPFRGSQINTHFRECVLSQNAYE